MTEKRRPVWWMWVQVGLFLLVCAAVVHQGVKLGRQLDLSDIRFAPLWFIPAVGAYLLGWLPSVYFWRQTLVDLGEDVPWAYAIRAYYCGHLGKYVPGKVLVLVIRAGLLRDQGVSTFHAAAAALYETLASMAVGAILSAALVPWIVPPETLARWFARLPGLGHPAVLSGAALAGALLGLPLLAKVLSVAVRKKLETSGAGAPDVAAIHADPRGLLGLAAGWACHGLSLGFTIAAMAPEPWTWSSWPAWTACAALATVAGFVAIFAPGGAGVREWVLMETLYPLLGPRALLAAVLLRCVWLGGEVLAAGALYYGVPRARKAAAVDAVDHRPSLQ